MTLRSISAKEIIRCRRGSDRAGRTSDGEGTVRERVQRIGTSLGEIAVTVRTHDSGSAPVIVMWPSLLMDHTLWAAQVEHLSDRFTTVAVDPPGHGRSAALTRLFTFDE